MYWQVGELFTSGTVSCYKYASEIVNEELDNNHVWSQKCDTDL